MAEEEYRRKNFFTDNKAFVFYKDWYNVFFSLDDDHEIVELLRAVLKYASSGELPNFKGGLNGCFVSIAQTIERDGLKWEETCEKRSKAGKNGGRPPKIVEIEATVKELQGQIFLLEEKAKKANGFLSNLKKPKKADTETETETETERDTDTVTDTDTVLHIGRERDKRSLSPPPSTPADYMDGNYYGEYGNVFLTVSNYNKLVVEFGAEKTAEYIRRVDEYSCERPAPYKNCYATIRKWIRQDREKEAEKIKTKKREMKAKGENASLPPPEELEKMIIEKVTKKDPIGESSTNEDNKK